MEDLEIYTGIIDYEKIMGKINWDKISVVFIKADSENPNQMNPCLHLSPEERREEIVEICSKIWRRHCGKINEELKEGK